MLPRNRIPLGVPTHVLGLQDPTCTDRSRGAFLPLRESGARNSIGHSEQELPESHKNLEHCILGIHMHIDLAHSQNNMLGLEPLCLSLRASSKVHNCRFQSFQMDWMRNTTRILIRREVDECLAPAVACTQHCSDTSLHLGLHLCRTTKPLECNAGVSLVNWTLRVDQRVAYFG